MTIATAVAPTAAHAAAPTLTITPARVQPGDTIKVSGTGFGAFERVDLYLDLTDVAFAATNTNGAFGPVSLTVPTSTSSATHYVSGEGHHSGLFAQGSVTVSVNWSAAGYGPSNRHANPYENAIGTDNVSGLDTAWARNVSDFGNQTPFVEYNGNLYIETIDGDIDALDPTGKLLWTATVAATLPAQSPVAYNGLVFFPDGAGNVTAFGASCRSDGGACSSKWTHSVGTSVTANLTVYGGLVYAPSADGTVHVLNPTTGAEAQTALGTASSAGATSSVAFQPDGYEYAQGSALVYKTPCCGGTVAEGGRLSDISASNGRAYFATDNGSLNAFGASNWTATLSSSCLADPSVGENLVFATSCSTLGAYVAGTGALRWQVSVSGGGSGTAVANGVLYACTGGTLSAYAATYGGLLWTGGRCAGAPIIANGTLYASGNGNIWAYRLGGADPSVVHRPTAAQLRG